MEETKLIMTAQELRLKNWILNGIGEEFQVNGETINNFDLGQMTLGSFSPIPLTAEWLLRLGCEQESKTSFYIKCLNSELKLNISRPNGTVICFKTYEWIGNIDYVHQLQNLYYALTGEELKLKE